MSIGTPTVHLASIRQMSTLKERMLELRAEKPSVTNIQLAKEAGVKPPSVSGWFGGGSESLKWESVAAIAKLYGVSQRWVAKGEGPKYPKSPWPFSIELHEVVSSLDDTDTWHAENALRAHLKMDPLPRDGLGGGEMERKTGTHGRS